MGAVLCCGLTTLDVVQTVTQVPGANEKVTALGRGCAARRLRRAFAAYIAFNRLGANYFFTAFW